MSTICLMMQLASLWRATCLHMRMYTLCLSLLHWHRTVLHNFPSNQQPNLHLLFSAHTHKQHIPLGHVGHVQVGLQGVDNGAMRFTNVRIPRDNLLDRFATVDRGGKYSSPYSPSRRFAATLGELTGGRVGLTCGSLGVLKVPVQAGSPPATSTSIAMLRILSILPAAFADQSAQRPLRRCHAGKVV